MLAGGAILQPSSASGSVTAVGALPVGVPAAVPGPPQATEDMAMTLLPSGGGQAQQQCKKNLQKMMGISPSDIDKYSRIFFPISFTCFNLMYWIIYLHVSDEIAEDLMMLNP